VHQVHQVGQVIVEHQEHLVIQALVELLDLVCQDFLATQVTVVYQAQVTQVTLELLVDKELQDGLDIVVVQVAMDNQVTVVIQELMVYLELQVIVVILALEFLDGLV
jgi:hypothetical protein